MFAGPLPCELKPQGIVSPRDCPRAAGVPAPALAQGVRVLHTTSSLPGARVSPHAGAVFCASHRGVRLRRPPHVPTCERQDCAAAARRQDWRPATGTRPRRKSRTRCPFINFSHQLGSLTGQCQVEACERLCPPGVLLQREHTYSGSPKQTTQLMVFRPLLLEQTPNRWPVGFVDPSHNVPKYIIPPIR